jgi:RNA polymerase sigma factor (sigma-70 family)
MMSDPISGGRVPNGAVTVAESATQGRFGSMSALYERYAGDAARLAYFLVGDRALAEELMQEGFIRLFARLEHLREVDATWPYLCRILTNLSRKHHRRQRVERAFLRRQAGPEPSGGDDSSTFVARDVLWRALQALPERQRVALVLRYYADLSQDQTARFMRCSPSAVNSLVARGLAAMRQRIGPEDV